MLSERELRSIRERARVGLPVSHAHVLLGDVRALLAHLDHITSHERRLPPHLDAMLRAEAERFLDGLAEDEEAGR